MYTFNSNMDKQDQIIYEDSEVLWAKIRGYPWWPAFVSIISLRLAMYTLPILQANVNTK